MANNFVLCAPLNRKMNFTVSLGQQGRPCPPGSLACGPFLWYLTSVFSTINNETKANKTKKQKCPMFSLANCLNVAVLQIVQPQRESSVKINSKFSIFCG